MSDVAKLKSQMEKQLEHLVAKELVQFEAIRHAWERFFGENRQYKELQPEMMQYLENQYDEMTAAAHFLNSVRHGAIEHYQEAQQ